MVQTIPVRPEDGDFLYRVYAASRAEEVAAWGWEPAQQEAFLWMQYSLRRQSYGWQYPGADHRVILADGAPAGAMIVARTPEAILLVDIALLPEFRGRGMGSALIRELQASAGEKVIRLHVDAANLWARRLYERLGFQVTTDDGIRYGMEWRA